MQNKIVKNVRDGVKSTPTKIKHMLGDFSSAYSCNFAARVATNVIPGIGSIADTAIMHVANKNQGERIEKVFKKMQDKVEKLEHISIDFHDPTFADYVIDICHKAQRARTDAKLDRFASSFSYQCEKSEPWDDAFAINRLIDQLDEVHIAILSAAINVDPCKVASSGKPLKIIATDTHDSEGVHDLFALLPEYSKESLILGCNDLVAHGLVYDEGSNRIGHFAKEWISPSSITYWFIDRIAAHNISPSIPS